MKKLLLLTAILITTSTFVIAQDFGSAIGLRLGSPVAVSYKTFISDYTALEGIVAFKSRSRSSYISVGAAMQVHQDINSAPGLQWYYGLGGAVLLWTYDSDFVGNQASLSVGVQGYLGLSYTFDGAPINLSIDWVPSLFIGGNSGFGAGNGALAIRYILAGY